LVECDQPRMCALYVTSRPAGMRGCGVRINFSEEALTLAQERGGVMAIDYIPPIG